MTLSQSSQLTFVPFLTSPWWSGQAFGVSNSFEKSNAISNAAAAFAGLDPFSSPESMIAMSFGVSLADSALSMLPSLRNSMAVRRTTLQKEGFD